MSIKTINRTLETNTRSYHDLVRSDDDRTMTAGGTAVHENEEEFIQ